jgi:hypothetical protein
LVAVSVVRDINVTLKLESGRETVNVQGNPSSIPTVHIGGGLSETFGRNECVENHRLHPELWPRDSGYQ